MSMASGHDVRPFRERNQTPDSVHRGSFIQIPGNVVVGGGGTNSSLRNGTPPVEKEGEIYRLVYVLFRGLSDSPWGKSFLTSARKMVMKSFLGALTFLSTTLALKDHFLCTICLNKQLENLRFYKKRAVESRINGIYY
jgi:hypothetical protein